MTKRKREFSIWRGQLAWRQKFQSYAVLRSEELAYIYGHTARNFLKQAVTLPTAIGMDRKNFA